MGLLDIVFFFFFWHLGPFFLVFFLLLGGRIGRLCHVQLCELKRNVNNLKYNGIALTFACSSAKLLTGGLERRRSRAEPVHLDIVISNLNQSNRRYPGVYGFVSPPGLFIHWFLKQMMEGDL